MKTTIALSAVMLSVAVLATGCNKKDDMGPAQEAGAAIDNAGRTVADETREGVAAADAAAERAGERVEAAADRAGDRIDNATAEVRQETREAADDAKEAASDATAAAGRSVERAGEKMQDASK